MMHISPCGWYSFELEVPDGWGLHDNTSETTLSPLDKSCQIELQSARKSSMAIDDEISRIHEDYLDQRQVQRRKTALKENAFGLKYYLSQGEGPDERLWVVGHGFWSNYCLFFRLHATAHRELESRMRLFHNLIETIQPLVNS